MSRILEFQPSEEQVIVSRVLLELHRAIDSNFPEAKGSSRQFTKTVLSSDSENTAINLPSQADQLSSRGAESAGQSIQPSPPPPKMASSTPVSLNRHSSTSGIEFSRVNDAFPKMTATALEETSWSKWLTRILAFSLFVAVAVGVWIYLFGISG
jgi:hypothetical protein